MFLAIARAGTLGAAARKLGQSQPTMGRRLRALEAVVGHTLFQRTGEGFVLTDEGASVLGHAERIEEEVLAFQRQLAGSEAELEGLLRLSSSDWFGRFMLAPVLAEFSRKHPRVCLELLIDARRFVDDLQRGCQYRDAAGGGQPVHERRIAQAGRTGRQAGIKLRSAALPAAFRHAEGGGKSPTGQRWRVRSHPRQCRARFGRRRTEARPNVGFAPRAAASVGVL